MNNIAAVVVTFNRLELLKGCINALRQQTVRPDAIVVVNNGSSDGTDSWLAEQNDLILVNQNNLGGAGGFYTGIKEAYEQGYEWIWVMDDDCVADKDCLENMLASRTSDDVLCLAPLVVDREGNIDTRHRGCFDFSQGSSSIYTPINEKNDGDILVDFASFVGLMVHSSAIKQVGLPKREFFIHNDDVEYCLRLNQVSRVQVSVKAKIYHLENATASGERKTFLHKVNYRTPFDKLWIRYYGMRNMTWIKKKYVFNQSKSTKYRMLLMLTRSFLSDSKAIILYDDYKYKRINFHFNAYRDGWKGEFDNDRPRRIAARN
ncbi:glycosyltransferase family 2 protein [Dyadobacter sp. CY326]|uniref:glycosyltransferase family 2 protein n=1 Tax=Dyadobacter sp. CY326 TaxID=2907300 RepID=UPI001F2D2FBD|nr:glycosyltransferase family 2 protein [Dyadobacter sp. CY326]MCE7066589.1 glycosyltransferase family 2 protein [Dyadobacter sp. CY326]